MARRLFGKAGNEEEEEMAIDLVALNTEITTDPTGRGYAPFVSSGHTQGVADLLNEKQSAIRMDNFVTGTQLLEAVVTTDYPTTSAEQDKRDLWRDVLAAVISEGTINANATRIKTHVLQVFSGAATRSNLAALQTRDGSRAEVLFGRDSVVTHRNVGLALGGA